ncbi:MAG: SpaA isopeptide-forming pilin-related protein [Chloroflexota bacterium]
MHSRGSLLLAARSRKGFAFLVIALFILSLAFQYAAAMVPSALAAEGDPVVTLQDGVNGCQGVLPTKGSENTNKRLVGGSLTPGGSATFEISYPVSADDVSGRETFVITDCVFIDGEAALKYDVSFVPNTENFILTFTLKIPAGTPIGAEYCNFAKTTAAPSESPASNRKAGPACFVVGGNISVLKTNEAGDPLAGATFHIVCKLPTTEAFLPDTIIDGVSHTSTSGGTITQDVTTDSTGRIAIQAPEGTSCKITETDPPDGYDLPADPSVTLVASAGGVHHTFVDPKSFVPAPGLTVDKGVSLSADGPFIASVNTTVGTTVYYRITITNTGNVPLTGVTLTDDKTTLTCSVPGTLAVGASFDCNYSTTAVLGTTVNVATGDSEETGPDTGTATVVATPPPPGPSLTIDKTNNAPIVNVGGTGIPTAAEGSTVTFTLTYNASGSPTNAVITDVIPAGLTYVAGSATSNSTFTFAGYDAGTRTLTWNAESVSSSGSVSYQAKVDTGAAGLQQPLRNLAAIDSDNTEKDTAHSDVFVPVPPLAETSVPTAPRTDVLTSGGTSAPGSNMGLVLLALALLAFAVVFVTPVPASMRSRIRRR